MKMQKRNGKRVIVMAQTIYLKEKFAHFRSEYDKNTCAKCLKREYDQ